jgi:hypothetical protein
MQQWKILGGAVTLSLGLVVTAVFSGAAVAQQVPASVVAQAAPAAVPAPVVAVAPASSPAVAAAKPAAERKVVRARDLMTPA